MAENIDINCDVEQTDNSNIEEHAQIENISKNLHRPICLSDGHGDGGDGELKGNTENAYNYKKDDKELEILLESAFEDFNKHTQNSSADCGLSNPTVDSPKFHQNEPIAQLSTSKEQDGDISTFTEEMSSEMAKHFEEAMQTLLGSEPDMMANIQKLSQTAASAGDTPGAQTDFTDTLNKTIADMAKNAEGLQDVSDKELLDMFGSLNVGNIPTEESDGTEFMPMMQGMMKSLMSKEILYPSLKELSDRYPKWLAANKDKIHKSKYDNFQKQADIIDQVCCKFEREDQCKTEDEKQNNWEEILKLMQQMQDLGQPPEEIVSEMAPGLEFDDLGLPKIPGMSGNQCSVM